MDIQDRELMESKLTQLSRVERLRAIVAAAKAKERVTAFDLAVRYNVSPNVIYRDIKELREAKMLPKNWGLEKKVRPKATEML